MKTTLCLCGLLLSLLPILSASAGPERLPPLRAVHIGGRLPSALRVPPEKIPALEGFTSRALTLDEIGRLAAVDGRTLDLRASRLRTAVLVQLPVRGRTAVTWTRVSRLGQQISIWTGQVWLDVQKPRGESVYDHARVPKELTWIVDPPAGAETIWLMLEEDTSTDALVVRDARVDEATRERLLVHGEEVDDLTLSLWTEGEKRPTSFVALVDNRTGRTRTRPFRTARLEIEGRLGTYVHRTPIEALPVVTARDVGPRGVPHPGALSAFTIPLPVSGLTFDPELSGEYELRLHVSQRRDSASGKGAWSGTLVSNPVRAWVTGWIAAEVAEKTGKKAPKIEIPPEPGTATPGPRGGVHVSGDWRYEVTWSAKGTRSESVLGRLLYEGREVRPGENGRPIRTPLGMLRHHGRPPVTCRPFGDAYEGRWYGRRGWFPE